MTYNIYHSFYDYLFLELGYPFLVMSEAKYRGRRTDSGVCGDLCLLSKRLLFERMQLVVINL